MMDWTTGLTFDHTITQAYQCDLMSISIMGIDQWTKVAKSKVD